MAAWWGTVSLCEDELAALIIRGVMITGATKVENLGQAICNFSKALLTVREDFSGVRFALYMSERREDSLLDG